jgi:hypothetical protein
MKKEQTLYHKTPNLKKAFSEIVKQGEYYLPQKQHKASRPKVFRRV